MNDRREELQRRANLRATLGELQELVGRVVSEQELIAPNELDTLRDAVQKRLAKARTQVWELSFQEKQQAQFADFVNALKHANASPVYIWTNRANVAGLIRVPSITDLNWSFGFSSLVEGIVRIVTTDLRDSILLDWSEVNGAQWLEIELAGDNWSTVAPDLFGLRAVAKSQP